MTPKRTPVGRSARVVLHNDGTAWLCTACGMVTQRSRTNPFPIIKHAPDCSIIGRKKGATKR